MIRRYLQFVKPYTFQLILTIIIGILKFGIPLLIPLLVKYTIDDVILIEGLTTAERFDKLWKVMVLFFVIFAVVRPPVEFLRQYLAQWTSNKILYDIRHYLYAHLQRLSSNFYSNNKVGEVISRVINDVEQTKNFILTGLMNLWLDLATIIIALVIMFSMNIQLTLVSIIIFPFYILGVWYFFSRLRKLTRNRSQAVAELQGFLHERVSGINVIRSFAIEDYEQGRFDKVNDNFLTKATKHAKWTAYSFMVVNSVTDIGPLLVIAFGAWQVIGGDLTVGVLAAFVAYLDRLYGPLRRLVSSSTMLTQSIASMDRIFHLIDEEYDIQDKKNAYSLPQVNGKIDFNDVHFKYDKEGEEILKGIDLNINVGETVAFVGMSGGGKSSLVSLIPRFYEVTGGSVQIDHHDVRDVTLHSLRDNIGMVMQDNILFSDSIKNNILMAKPDASDAEVYRAAERANADIFIQALDYGYETEVGERGVKLSGGQKQRIAIARVFLKNPPVLVLDEATSALDLESEAIIQETLEDLSSDRTTIIVAHRLSTITHADRIYVIENGQVVESGTHEALLEQHGAYHRLYSIQDVHV